MSETLSTWTIEQTQFDVKTNRHYEGLFAIGSGPLQNRASLEEGLSNDPQNAEYLRIMGNVTVEESRETKSRIGTYLPGLSGPHPTCLVQMLNLPAVHGLVLFADGQQLDMERCEITDFRRAIDLRTGKLQRSFVWKTPKGATLCVSFERFISAKRRHLMALRNIVEHIDGPAAEIRYIGTIDPDVRTNGYDHFTDVKVLQDPMSVVVTTNGNDEVAASAILKADRDIRWTSEAASRWIGTSGFVHLEPGQTSTVDKFASVISTRQTANKPLVAAQRIVWDAMGAGYEKIAQENDAVWEERWATTAIELEGDPESQRALRLSQYHLLRCMVEGDSRCAIDAKGAAGEAYCGRYFWDTEMFILPMFLYTRPEVGKTLASFRIHSLNGARRNAERYGYPGAKFAWESSPEGDENCPGWQYADHEVHVTPDACYGLWHALLVTLEDGQYLSQVAEALTESSRYLRERMSYNDELGEWEMLMVMGPDEYTPFSRNSHYTNRMTALTLKLTCEAWNKLETTDAEAATDLRQKITLKSNELDDYAAIADKIRLPFDTEKDLVLQSDDFFNYAPLDFEKYWPDRSKRIGAVVSQERIYRSQVLKQADVVQMMAMFPDQFTPEQMKIAYDTYEPLTSHDSSLSQSMHAILSAWLGNEEEALRMWDITAGLDLEEGEAADGVHIACAGANWQVVVFGFCGIRTKMQSDVLYIDPHLPTRWKSVKFPFVWNSQPLTITIAGNDVTVENHGDVAIEAMIRGETETIAPQ